MAHCRRRFQRDSSTDQLRADGAAGRSERNAAVDAAGNRRHGPGPSTRPDDGELVSDCGGSCGWCGELGIVLAGVQYQQACNEQSWCKECERGDAPNPEPDPFFPAWHPATLCCCFARRQSSCPTLLHTDQAAVKSLALSTLRTRMPRHLFGGSAVVESLGEKARTRSFATPAFAGCAYRNVTNDSFLQRGTRPVNDSSPIG